MQSIEPWIPLLMLGVLQTVAARVAEEMGVPVGAEVGYCIRFEEVTTPVRENVCDHDIVSNFQQHLSYWRLLVNCTSCI